MGHHDDVDHYSSVEDIARRVWCHAHCQMPGFRGWGCMCEPCFSKSPVSSSCVIVGKLSVAAKALVRLSPVDAVLLCTKTTSK